MAHLKLRSYTQPWGKNNPVQTSLYPNLLTMRKETFLHKQRSELPAAINNRKITVTSRHTFKLLKCSNALKRADKTSKTALYINTVQKRMTEINLYIVIFAQYS